MAEVAVEDRADTRERGGNEGCSRAAAVCREDGFGKSREGAWADVHPGVEGFKAAMKKEARGIATAGLEGQNG